MVRARCSLHHWLVAKNTAGAKLNLPLCQSRLTILHGAVSFLSPTPSPPSSYTLAERAPPLSFFLCDPRLLTRHSLPPSVMTALALRST